ncbi:MAG: methyltransferase [Beijerinckiaceae bacterium]|nr:methyltransferase [Beijerinckiaceae bacterium]
MKLPASDNRQAFIISNTVQSPTLFVPEIDLYMANEATALWEKTESELGEIGLPPPFWAFAWAGGQALARHILDHPQLVRGKRVLDFAAGSGLVAIAAAKSGAAHVTACEIEAFALDAIALNAHANGVAIDAQLGDFIGRDDGWDVVLAGDVSYERDMAERVTCWLQSLHERGATVLIGDPGRAYLARDRLEKIAEHDVPVIRDLEDADVKKTAVWRFK